MKIRSSIAARQFGDALPVIPPTIEKVEAMVKASGLSAGDNYCARAAVLW